MTQFDIIVVGAGHAGCETALAAARLGARVGLVTLRADRIAQMSCNPAIGGVAKGHLVREIDALGGAMGQVADASGIQFRRLNLSRGPAVRSTRCQSDSARYRQRMGNVVRGVTNIDVIEDEAIGFVIENGRCCGLMTNRIGALRASAVVITTGTFLNGLCHIGEERFAGGRVNDAPALHLSDSLRDLGIELRRFKTGTTPRLAGSTIDWHELEPQHGDDPQPRFSFDNVANDLEQVPCYLTYTTHHTHEIIRDNLSRSPLYQGVIAGLGPRYCPSIEDKIVRFADKRRHQIFLEPEGLDTEWVYPNGISTSLPRDAQEAFLRTIPGLREVRVLQHGYAVEYDYAPPTQLLPTLMTKSTPGLFLAGQINGTSGYEEAAIQGLIAGTNAVRFAGGQPGWIVGRHEGYAGVLIDDLVTKGVDEPYRVFTSRAEYRLSLRESNAEERLTPIGHRLGLVSDDRMARAMARKSQRATLEKWLATTPVGRDLKDSLGFERDTDSGLKRVEALRRPGVSINDLLDVDFHYTSADAQMVEEEIKYAGYIQRELRQIARLRELEDLRLPEDIEMPGLSAEVIEKLERVRPATLGQASRIPGITPAALALLRVHAHRRSQ